MGLNRLAREGYAGASTAYEQGRPGYPRDAVERLLLELEIRPGTPVLDLAAGTGKLTRELVAAGADVLAVEPVEGMRAALAGALPGTAEEIPLPDGRVAAVTVGQAFHWFDGARALAEIHRVLRPGGSLGLVWNARDESVPWVARLTEIIDPYERGAPRYRSGRWREAFEETRFFGPLQEASFWHVHALDEEGLVARVASISFIAALPEGEQEHVFGRVRELVSGSQKVGLPYRTDVYWCRRA